MSFEKTIEFTKENIDEISGNLQKKSAQAAVLAKLREKKKAED